MSENTILFPFVSVAQNENRLDFRSVPKREMKIGKNREEIQNFSLWSWNGNLSSTNFVSGLGTETHLLRIPFLFKGMETEQN